MSCLLKSLDRQRRFIVLPVQPSVGPCKEVLVTDENSLDDDKVVVEQFTDIPVFRKTSLTSFWTMRMLL